jgi:glutamate synthase domain-containing protein 1
MVAPGRLRDAFPDFSHPELVACAAVFHQRFSTNTLPRWRLAQPFRMLAHNGEINTIQGNRNWVRARGAKYKSPLVELSDLGPLVSLDGSDSQSLDNMLEVLVAGGLDVLAAMRILIPPAWASRDDLDEDLEAFYEYYALHTEPWDGPAGIVLCDSRYAACTLDRNGLRPCPLGQVGRQPSDRRFRGRSVGPAARTHRREGPARTRRDDRRSTWSGTACSTTAPSTTSTARARRSRSGCARASRTSNRI